MRPTIRYRRLPHGKGLSAPSRCSILASGFDLKAAVTGPLRSGERALFPTGFAFAIPEGYEGQIRPRSGLALNHGIAVLNAPGTIDADYRGEVHVLLYNSSLGDYIVNRGDRIAQLVFAPVVTVALEPAEQLGDTARGTGAFGSTGAR